MPSGATRYGVPSWTDQRVAHDGVLLGGLDERERDEVGERDLPRLAGGLESLVEQLRRLSSSTPTGSTRNVVAVGTVRLSFMLATSLAAGPLMGEAPGGAGPARRRRGRPWAAGDGGARLGGGRAAAAAAAVAVGPLADDAALEQPPPLRPDRGGVPEKFLVHRLGEPGVGGFEYVRIHDVHHPDRCAHQEGSRSGRDPGVGCRKITGRHRQGSTTDEGVHAGRGPSSPLVADRRAAAAKGPGRRIRSRASPPCGSPGAIYGQGGSIRSSKGAWHA